MKKKKPEPAGNTGAEITPGMRGRNEWMQSLLKRTSYFRIGEKPTPEEMNER